MAERIGNISIGIFLVLCLAYQAYGQVNCTTTGGGRFPDPNDTTCKNYTYCIFVTASNSYVSYNYVCPTTSVFNPGSGQCTAPTNYACNVNATAASVCTAEGFIPDPAVTDCSSYIGCVNDSGTFVPTTYPCPANTSYNPNTTFCDSSYTCPTQQTTAPQTTPTFACSANGRFANTTDTACKTYFLCVRAVNGTFAQYQYTCPTTSVFSPNSRMCTTAYVCPTAAG